VPDHDFQDREYIKISKTSQISQKVERKDSKTGKNLPNLSFDVGISVVLPILIGLFIGQFLDQKFQTTPKMTIALLFTGVFVGFISLIVLAQNASKD